MDLAAARGVEEPPQGQPSAAAAGGAAARGGAALVLASVESITLNDNPAVTEKGVGALADACAAGALPALESLHVDGGADHARFGEVCEARGIDWEM